MKSFFIIFFLLFSIYSSSQDINIPDAVFLNKLISQGVDTNNDGIIQLTEALVITNLNVDSFGAQNKIENMEGIQHFTNLVELSCANNLITSLDVSTLANLEVLHCYSNQITSLNITGLSQLTSFWAAWNELSNIDFSGLDNIWWVYINDNNFEEIDLTGLENLEVFWMANNLLSTIDFTPTPNIKYIDVSGNFLTEIDVNQLFLLESLDCSNNQIIEASISNAVNLRSLYIGLNLIQQIDGSQNPNFIELHCELNPNLTYINMKNGAISYSDPDSLYFGFLFYELPQLTFICIDVGEEEALADSGYDPENVTVSNTDCTLSIADVSLNAFSLYPNPIRQEVYITNA